MPTLKSYFTTSALLCSAVLSGCASNVPLMQCQVMSRTDIVQHIDARQVIDDLVVGICPPPESFEDLSIKRNPAPVVVPDFVDVQTLQPDKTGVVLGDIFRASIFNVCKVPIRQAELSRNFRLNAGGLTALTRNPSEVRERDFRASVAMIGTYNLEGNKLTLIARRVDLESATFLAVTSKEVSWACESPVVGENHLVFKVK
jgi:FlgO protein